MLRKFTLSLIFGALTPLFVLAQTGSGSLEGVVTDAESGDPLPFVNVVLILNGSQSSGGSTNFDGEYSIKPIEAGVYDVSFSFVGYQSKVISGLVIKSNKITFQNITLGEGVALKEAEVIEYKTPLIDKDGGSSGGTVTRDAIAKMPGRSANAVALTVGGVSDAGTGGGISIRGARTSGTDTYIDGIKIRGSSNLPKSAIQEVSAITGGLPANYGDVTGGIINITTRGASSFYFGGVELISSGIPVDQTAYGLDRYGYNLLEGVVSGPLAWKKDSEGKKVKPLLGFFLSGNVQYEKDPRPRFDGNYLISEEAADRIRTAPLEPQIDNTTGEVNGVNQTNNFLLEDDFSRVPTRPNVAYNQASLAGKIDVTTSPTINLTFGGSANFQRYRNGNFGSSLMNSENNLRTTEFDWRVYGKFAQRFVDSQDDEEASSSNLKNVFYQIMLDYSQTFDRTEDQNHERDFFKYGHYGFYDYDLVETFTPSPEGGLETSGFQVFDLTYDPSEFNPVLADYQSLHTDIVGSATLEEIAASQGLRNGDQLPSVYGLWNPNGQLNSFSGDIISGGANYSESSGSQIRLTAAGSADIGDHAVQIGFEFEQRRESFYALNARELWRIGRLSTNSHILELDPDNATIGIGPGGVTTFIPRLIGENQFAFDRNLRTSLGLNPDGSDFIILDNLSPDQLSLDFFSADDLLNSGDNLVTYFGYDHLGNRLSSGQTPTLDDFLTSVDENGNPTRAIGAFEPIYMAGYVMDKFSFDDIIFNVGLRVSRYDANQPVPKDPFVIGEARTAGEVSDLGEHPSNIGEDYVVYVDDVNPSSIKGYRDGFQFYNALGEPIASTAASLNSSYNGLPLPYLVGDPGDALNSNAFEDYKAQVNVMPRINFSFPISDEALFFAHYDILVQRPSGNSRFNPLSYFFLENNGGTINNPALRPEKTIEYELGFQQVLTRSSSLKVSAYYREVRDMIQIRRLAGAFPRTYSTFDNIDFGTTKGLSIAYDLRKTGNIWMLANYVLQFADGTGSSATTSNALINAGLPNLRVINPLTNDQRHAFNFTVDYRYGEGKDYNGPVWGGKQVFKNTGANLIARLGSGTPYTAAQFPFALGSGQATTEGSLNGSRLPWTTTVNLQFDRNWTLKLGKKEGENAKTANLNVYIWFQNLFNIRNVLGVYRFTGVSDDDGYLASDIGQENLASRPSAAAFSNYYRMSVDNPGNLGTPRQIRLGVKFDF